MSNTRYNKLESQLFFFFLLSPSYLCEVFKPWWDPHSSCSSHPHWSGADSSVRAPVLWSWSHRSWLVHDWRWTLIVVHIEARWWRLNMVSVALWRNRVRGYGLATRMSHGVRRLVIGVWVTWKKKTVMLCFSSFTGTFNQYLFETVFNFEQSSSVVTHKHTCSFTKHHHRTFKDNNLLLISF